MKQSKFDKPSSRKALHFLPFCALALLLSACAKMGQPDGGWYDETPPQVIAESPSDGATGVNSKKATLYFSEYIKIDNPTENVVVSPPQKEAPEIKNEGKKISVKLIDDLKPNTTYTIDFSNAISDNNEGNPLGNYTYTFSTGDHIDTMEVAGCVVEADNLEPVKGILVGLYDNLADSAFTTLPMLRVARTDDTGHFDIKGVRNGKYHVFALQDADNNYMFNAKSEMIAFDKTVYATTCRPDIRQDTIWRDSLHIQDIKRIPYTHFLPDNIVLRAFNEELTDRYFQKADRAEADHFSLIFTYGDSEMPRIKGLNFNADNAFIVEPSVNTDTITYWLRDSALVDQDTLNIQLQYRMTDSTGTLVPQTDTLQILSKQPYEKRLKKQQEQFEKWKKTQEKRKKKGESYQTVMPAELLKPDYNIGSTINPDQTPTIYMPKPLARMDTAKIHLYEKIDTTWSPIPFQIGEDPSRPRTYRLIGEWRPGRQYSLETDSMAFTDIYGHVSAADKQGFRVPNEDEYNTLPVNITGFDGKHIVVRLLDQSGKTIKEQATDNSQVVFQWIKPGTYYMSMFVDDNRNGRWDTGDYKANRQPEALYYYDDKIERKAKWDDVVTWNPTAKPLNQQKPSRLVKTKSSAQKKIKNRNAERAKSLGIPYIPGQTGVTEKK